MEHAGDLGIVGAVVDAAVDPGRGPLLLGHEAADAAPAGQGVAGLLPELGDLAVGREGDPGQALVGGVVDPVEADEPSMVVGDDAFTVSALAGIAQAQDENGRLDPVERLHQLRQAEQRQGALIGQQVELGMLDDLAGLADADDLDAEGRPITGMELHRVQSPDRAGRGRRREEWQGW